MSGKRAFDLAVGLVLALAAAPVVAILAVLVALEGGRPIYTQARVGRYGRIFRIFKLRTMTLDADARLAAYLTENPEAAEEWAHSQKLRDDPRVTPLGRLLRRTSLDELPQLWNVLAGDMSLVGPRPMMERQRTLYPGSAYFALRPGITGPWQVSERNQTSFAERANYDTRYCSEASLWLDLRLLAQTVSVVLRRTGC